jgi:hypothetical protein
MQELSVALFNFHTTMPHVNQSLYLGALVLRVFVKIDEGPVECGDTKCDKPGTHHLQGAPALIAHNLI